MLKMQIGNLLKPTSQPKKFFLPSIPHFPTFFVPLHHQNYVQTHALACPPGHGPHAGGS